MFPFSDHYWKATHEYLKCHVHDGERLLAPREFVSEFAEVDSLYTLHHSAEAYDWVVLPKKQLEFFSLQFLEQLKSSFSTCFSNSLFICFKKGERSKNSTSYDGNESSSLLWEQARQLRSQNLKEQSSSSVVLLHIPKTGGSSLHSLLLACFPKEKVAPIRYNQLLDYPPEELNRFCFFSGHFHIDTLSVVADPKQIITMLREPRSRLLSDYYFARAHKWSYIYSEPKRFSIAPHPFDEAKSLNLLPFLQKMGSELGSCMVRNLSSNNLSLDDRIAQAKENLSAFAAFGLLERMSESIETIFSILRLPVPEAVPTLLERRTLAELEYFEKVEEEELTAEIEDILEKSIQPDKLLYDYAAQLFSSRLKQNLDSPLTVSTSLSLPIDKTYIINLPSEDSRREHIIQEVERFGLRNYEVIEALTPDSPLVKELFESDMVLKFPPCFRCKKNRCACDNNILIPPQIANWCSYLTVLKTILKSDDKFFLVCEDDIAFTDRAQSIFQALLSHKTFEQYDIHVDKPLLIGIGKTWGSDHERTHPPYLSHEIAMCNPCFFLNREMAELLVQSLKRIEYTSDTFIHEIVASTAECQNFIMKPSPVYDLSTGPKAKFHSTIHPKGIDESDRVREKEHIKRVEYKEFLCIGHPRCGTGFIPEVLKAMRYEVGHEYMGYNGISSWMVAVDDVYPYGNFQSDAFSARYYFEHIIHVIRNPWDAIPSIIRENRHSPHFCSYLFRRKHIGSALPAEYHQDFSLREEVEIAIESYLSWNALCERRNPTITLRLEHDLPKLQSLLNTWLDEDCIKNLFRNENKPYGGKYYEKPTLEPGDFREIRSSLLERLIHFCEIHNYPSLEKCDEFNK